MYNILLYITPIAVVDSINPTATALQIYLLSTPKPVARSVTFIFGVFAAYFTAGLLFTMGFGGVIKNVINRVGEFFHLLQYGSVGEFMYVIQFIIGVVMIILGCQIGQLSKKQTTSEPRQVKRPRVLKPINTFLLGLAVTFWESSTALPYVAAIQRILQAKLNFHELIVVLLFYNLIFVFPLISLLGIYIVHPKNSSVLINKIDQIMESPKIHQILLIGIGLFLVIDCFTRGTNFGWRIE
ncbi:hypothetical protein A6S26_34050 [Nostoc sp. ATCC 43529]|nr:hypothetical protein A6S26_34050 [Nostoc sp. ATCC 43529]